MAKLYSFNSLSLWLRRHLAAARNARVNEPLPRLQVAVYAYHSGRGGRGRLKSSNGRMCGGDDDHDHDEQPLAANQLSQRQRRRQLSLVCSAAG